MTLCHASIRMFTQGDNRTDLDWWFKHHRPRLLEGMLLQGASRYCTTEPLCPNQVLTWPQTAHDCLFSATLMGIRKLPGADTSSIHEVFCLREPIGAPNHHSLPPPHASSLCAVSFTLLKGTLLISLCAYLCPMPFAVQLRQPFTPLILSCSGFLVLSDKRQDSFSPLPLKQDCPSLPLIASVFTSFSWSRLDK